MFVYVIGPESSGPFKIGIASDVARRLGALQIGSPVDLRVHVTERHPSRAAALAREAELHAKFASVRRRGEWFDIDLANLLAEIDADDEVVEQKYSRAENLDYFTRGAASLSAEALAKVCALHGIPVCPAALGNHLLVLHHGPA